MKLAVFDLDGVVFDDSHRVAFALAKNWGEYFTPTRVLADPVFDMARTLIRIMQEDGWEIAYLTGRRNDIRPVTEKALDLAGLPMGRLTMRDYPEPQGKLRLAEYKVNVLRDLMNTRPDLEDVVLFEDDPEVVRFTQEQLGSSHAMLCDWHIKEPAMVTLATA